MGDTSFDKLNQLLNEKKKERIWLEKELQNLKLVNESITYETILNEDKNLKTSLDKIREIEKKVNQLSFQRLILPNEIKNNYLPLFDSIQHIQKPFLITQPLIRTSTPSESEVSESSELFIKPINGYIPPSQRISIHFGKVEKEQKEFTTQVIEFDKSPELDRNFDILKEKMKHKHYRCFYNSSLDGLYSAKINSSLRNVKNAMFMITSTDGFVFGVFSSSFQSPKHSYGSHDTDGFVFTLLSPLHLEPVISFNSSDNMITLPLLKRKDEIFSIPDFLWITKQKCWIEVDDFCAVYSLPPFCDNQSFSNIFTPLNGNNEFFLDSIYGLEWFDD
ncbi:hypothetical protein ENUP19_0328G0033 [Entamoeba nuttalli]|uniref:TLDc domain-containing protein n=2 Tax=Entamoeba nuttalli TaxID=412467 RepID=K2GEQ8_ENTNP|nr:hypothetical protein ENU1_068250 [Entamoeba nuttalli P19]EKE41091.1 hypothetical protein ENU1_068250 [Entamoeba nuttalli P19]|eukprot:XP_008856574.1 hypothetical protein ENU1_068250 [Entamoeba nuttalli P19]